MYVCVRASVCVRARVRWCACVCKQCGAYTSERASELNQNRTGETECSDRALGATETDDAAAAAATARTMIGMLMYVHVCVCMHSTLENASHAGECQYVCVWMIERSVSYQRVSGERDEHTSR